MIWRGYDYTFGAVSIHGTVEHVEFDISKSYCKVQLRNHSAVPIVSLVGPVSRSCDSVVSTAAGTGWARCQLRACAHASHLRMPDTRTLDFFVCAHVLHAIPIRKLV